MSNVTLKSKALEVQVERNKLSADKIASGTTVFGMTGSMESSDALLRQITINTLYENSLGVGKGLRSDAAKSMWNEGEHHEFPITFNLQYRYNLTDEFRTNFATDFRGLSIEIDAFDTEGRAGTGPILECPNDVKLNKICLRQRSLSSMLMIDQVYYDFNENKWYLEVEDMETGETTKEDLTENRLQAFSRNFNNDYTYAVYVVGDLDSTSTATKAKYKARAGYLVDLLGLRLKIDN